MRLLLVSDQTEASGPFKHETCVLNPISVAVVVAFFFCWAPFHAQRLLAVYLSGADPEAQEPLVEVYFVLMYASGILYFLSTCVNPLLYHIMSKKFRETFWVSTNIIKTVV